MEKLEQDLEKMKNESGEVEYPESLEIEEDRSGSIEGAEGKPSDGEPSAESKTEDEKIRQERDEYYDLLLRKQAEFDNFRRRTAKERSEVSLSAQREVLSEILPVLDACEKGLETMESSNDGSVSESFLLGYELLLKQLTAVLEKFSVEEVPGVGETFDPMVHEAVVREVSREYAEGEILEEFRKGYILKGRLLRPSQVKVAVWPDNEEEET